jgi:hypothetical protein
MNVSKQWLRLFLWVAPNSEIDMGRARIQREMKTPKPRCACMLRVAKLLARANLMLSIGQHNCQFHTWNRAQICNSIIKSRRTLISWWNNLSIQVMLRAKQKIISAF